MRDVPEALATRIEGGAATLCHAWVLRRSDGAVLGFTDHDQDLDLGGVTCRAASGWTAGAALSETGFRCGSISAAGGLDEAALTDGDLEAGLYDGAQVELWRVDWRNPDVRILIQKALMTRIRRDGSAFTAELEGPLGVLEKVVGRTYGRQCDATLGDSRCGVDIASFPGAVCDGSWETCVGRFGNGAAFRGFPDIPGDDFLMAIPQQGGRHDGGSRR
jgi:hypothetical protein